MTTPLEALDGIMPYGVNVSAATRTTYMTADGDSSRVDGSFIMLPEGPCQIQVTWPGKQDAYVRWVDSANNEKGIPIEISGGGVFPKDRYYRRSPRRQTAIPHPYQRRAGNNRNGHNLPDSTITVGVVKNDYPYQVCESVAVGHAYCGQHGILVRQNFQDERDHRGTKYASGTAGGREYCDRGLVREITCDSSGGNNRADSEGGNSRRGIWHIPAGHTPRAGKHLGRVCERHHLRQRYGGNWGGGRRNRRLPLRPAHHLAAGVVA